MVVCYYVFLLLGLSFHSILVDVAAIRRLLVPDAADLFPGFPVPGCQTRSHSRQGQIKVALEIIPIVIGLVESRKSWQ